MKKHLTKLQKKRLAEFHASIIDNLYIPQGPTQKQAAFLLQSDIKEGFYGGAARGGKSSALLIAALQYVTEPDYAALILRRTFRQLALEDAIMDRAERWLSQTDAKWVGVDKKWRFPSGAALTFGYLDTERDKYQYQSAAFQFIAFDELSQFTKSQYTYLFSRLTRLEGSTTPLRMRAASNPGDIGHEWVKARFITPTLAEMKTRGRFFVPALLEDNPHVDQPAYEDSLIELDPVTYEQLRHGNWDISIAGNMFKRESFDIVANAPPRLQQVRYWDSAASEPKKNTDPDWTVGALMSTSNGQYYIKSIVRFQKTPAEAEKIIKQTAEIDGISTKIIGEQEPGASGVIAIDHYARDILQGYAFTGIKSTGSKVVRAQPFSAAVENGNVKICKDCQWIEDMLYELVAFPTKGIHDDIVDALSGAFNALFIPATRDQVHTYYIPDISQKQTRGYRL
jgi:predicted phage terminase large subunit-like protein